MVVFFETDEEEVELQKLAFYIGWRWNNTTQCNGIYIRKNIPYKAISFSNTSFTMFYSNKEYNKEKCIWLNYKGINAEIIKELYIPIKNNPKSKFIMKRRRREIQNFKRKSI